jgi:hypothetical protein
MRYRARHSRKYPPRVATKAPAGWYADPWKTGKARYWDGLRWTNLVAL